MLDCLFFFCRFVSLFGLLRFVGGWFDYGVFFVSVKVFVRITLYSRPVFVHPQPHNI